MRRGASWAIVPVKPLHRAKRRLAAHLSAPARQRLVLAMLEDVLAALLASGAIDRVLVVSPDLRVAELAAAKGAMVLAEERIEGLNAAVRKGLREARARGAARALVLPGDVPLATAGEIARVLGAAPPPPSVSIVPSADGQGTNALLLAPADAIAPAFGRGSCRRHVARALAQGCAIEVLRLPGLASDIDAPVDLARLLAAGRRAERYRFAALARGGGARQTAPAPQGRCR
jgi:2-phospho-L-lactate guanylyltransferase